MMQDIKPYSPHSMEKINGETTLATNIYPLFIPNIDF